MIFEYQAGQCITGVADTADFDDELAVLGDVFLKNVLAVFDVGESTMCFAAQEL